MLCNVFANIWHVLQALLYVHVFFVPYWRLRGPKLIEVSPTTKHRFGLQVYLGTDRLDGN